MFATGLGTLLLPKGALELSLPLGVVGDPPFRHGPVLLPLSPQTWFVSLGSRWRSSWPRQVRGAGRAKGVGSSWGTPDLPLPAGDRDAAETRSQHTGGGQPTHPQHPLCPPEPIVGPIPVVSRVSGMGDTGPAHSRLLRDIMALTCSHVHWAEETLAWGPLSLSSAHRHHAGQAHCPLAWNWSCPPYNRSYGIVPRPPFTASALGREDFIHGLYFRDT